MPGFIGKYSAYIIGFGIIAFSVVILTTELEFAEIPGYVWLLLNAIGLAAIREGVNAVSPNDNKGWKSYTAAVAIAILGIFKMFGIEFPVEVIAGFEGLGIIGIKDALEKIHL